MQDDPVGAPGDGNAVERVGVADHLLAGAVHRADPGTAGEDERAIDVEEHELGHGRKPIYNRRQED